MKDIIDQLKQKRAQAKQGGGKMRIVAPLNTGSCGYIADVMFPRDTRKHFCCLFAMLRNNRPQNPGKILGIFR